MNATETFAFIFIVVIMAVCTAVYACLVHNGRMFKDDED